MSSFLSVEHFMSHEKNTILEMWKSIFVGKFPNDEFFDNIQWSMEFSICCQVLEFIAVFKILKRMFSSCWKTAHKQKYMNFFLWFKITCVFLKTRVKIWKYSWLTLWVYQILLCEWWQDNFRWIYNSRQTQKVMNIFKKLHCLENQCSQYHESKYKNQLVFQNTDHRTSLFEYHIRDIWKQ